MKKLLLILTIFTFVFALQAQPTITPIATGLNSPLGIELDADGNLWVAESGTGQSDGSITIIRPDGSLEKFAEGLPSFFNPETGDVAGPEHAQPLGEGMIGVTVAPQPDSLERTILVFAIGDYTPGTPLDRDDIRSVIYVGKTVLKTRDDSNPYTFVHDGCDLYIADAGADAIVRRVGLTGEVKIFAQLPPVPNPLPFGPPFADAVPTRIIKNPDGGFYVSQLTGFPFIPGASKIWSVDEGGTIAPYDSNYTLVTDLAISPEDGGLLALQFGLFDFSQPIPIVFNSALITHTHPDGSRDTLVSGFGPSPGMAVADNGVIYVTDIFTGRVLKIDNITGVWNPEAPGRPTNLKVWPNPASEAVNLDFTLQSGGAVQVEVYDIQGRLLTRKDLGYRAAGLNSASLTVAEIARTEVPQMVVVRLKGAGIDSKQMVAIHE